MSYAVAVPRRRVLADVVPRCAAGTGGLLTPFTFGGMVKAVLAAALPPAAGKLVGRR